MDGDHFFEVDIFFEGGDARYDVRSNSNRAEFNRLFTLHRDVSGELRDLVAGDKVWEPILKRQAGLRLMAPSCAVEELFSFLCTSNNHLPRILKMVGWLGERGLDRDGGSWRRFPTLEVIAGLSELELREAGFGYRGKTIPLVAQEILRNGGVDWLTELRRGGYRAAFDMLCDLPGVGPKLADCICLFALGFGEAVPVDTHIWKMMTEHFFPEWRGTGVTEKKYRACGELLRDRFGNLAGAAHQLLFVESLKRGKS